MLRIRNNKKNGKLKGDGSLSHCPYCVKDGVEFTIISDGAIEEAGAMFQDVSCEKCGRRFVETWVEATWEEV